MIPHDTPRQQDPVEGRASNARSALGDSFLRYFHLYEHAPVGYVTLTLEGLTSEINRIGARLLGCAPEQVVNKPFIWLVMPESLECWTRFSDATARDGQHTAELALKRMDGTVFSARLDGIYLRHEQFSEYGGPGDGSCPSAMGIT